MAVPNTMEPLAWLRKHLDEEGSDLLREMIREFAEQLMRPRPKACATPATARSAPSG